MTTSSIPLPSASLPKTLQQRALPILLSRLNDLPPNSSEISPLLTTIVHILSSRQISSPHFPSLTAPLKTLLNLFSSKPSKLTPSISLKFILDLIIAYPHHPQSVSAILDNLLPSNEGVVDDIGEILLPSLASRLWDIKHKPLSESTSVLHILLLLLRAHPSIKEAIISKTDLLVPALNIAYSYLVSYGDTSPEVEVVVKAKSDILFILDGLVSGLAGGERERVLGLIDGSGSRSGTNRKNELLRGGLREDYETLFGVSGEGSGTFGERDLGVLEKLRNDQATYDPRLKPLQNLFPSIPPSLIIKALHHPKYSAGPSDQTPSEAIAPLVDAILSGGGDLPEDLGQLKEVVRGLGQDPLPSAGENSSTHADASASGSGSGTRSSKVERRNIWNEELDLSRLKLANDESSLPQLSTSIPDNLRASILRLVESQKEEEEEQRLALLEAHGSNGQSLGGIGGGGVNTPRKRRGLLSRLEEGDGEMDDDLVPARVKIGAEGEESDSERGSNSDLESARSASPPPRTKQQENQAILELTYLANKKVFDRDSETRRSKARAELRETTGMDDSQLEGWKSMLERNPHKDAILSRHSWSPNHGSGGTGHESGGSGRGRGGDSCGGRGGGGRGGRGGDGGSSGGSGSGGGGGRGRGGSKGGKGHSNAARTRGHDKKMSKMGAGV